MAPRAGAGHGGRRRPRWTRSSALLRAELRPAGAVAVHGNRHTDFVAAVCAAHLHEHRGVEPAEGLRAAAAAGLMVTRRRRAALLGRRLRGA